MLAHCNRKLVLLTTVAACNDMRWRRQPHTPGEEGMQDMRIVAAIYDAAARAATVKLPLVSGRDAFRGPAPT